MDIKKQQETSRRDQEQVVSREEEEPGRRVEGMHARWVKEAGEKGTGKKSESKKEQLLKTLS